MVDGRQPRTVVSFSWCDGSLGLLCIVMADDSLTKDQLEQINAEVKPFGAIVMNSGHENHFFTGALTLRYLNEAVTVSFRKKRADHNLNVKDRKGLLIADAFAGNRDARFSEQLEPFIFKENVCTNAVNVKSLCSSKKQSIFYPNK